jgi:hypothetical protein
MATDSTARRMIENDRQANDRYKSRIIQLENISTELLTRVRDLENNARLTVAGRYNEVREDAKMTPPLRETATGNVVGDYAAEAQKIYNERTAGDFTWTGFLANYGNAVLEAYAKGEVKQIPHNEPEPELMVPISVLEMLRLDFNALQRERNRQKNPNAASAYGKASRKVANAIQRARVQNTDGY